MIFTRLLQSFFLLLVKIYQIGISPYFPSACRYQPTCSGYMKEALIEHGPFKGLWLGLKRIGRCHPWGSCGYDPVPPNPNKKQAKD